MKSKSTLRVFLALAGSTLLTLTCASAATYYWDANDGTDGFQDADPGPAGTWSASTPSTATGGFTTDPAGATVISANPAVGTTIADVIIFGTGSTTDLAPLYPFTGAITIDGTVNAKSIHCSANHPTFVAGTNPVFNFAAEGRFEHATEGTVTLPAITLTGATTSMTWKAGFIDNLSIENVINNAAKNIFEGTGSFIFVKGGSELGPVGTPIVFNGGGLRLSTGFPYATMSAFSADHPITLNPNVSFGLAPWGFAFTVDTPLNLGTGGLYIAGQNAASPVIITQPQDHTGGTFLVGGVAQVSENAQLGDITSPLVFGSGPLGTGEGANGTLRITGTAMTSLGARPLVLTPDKGVSFDIANAANIFTVDQALTQGTGGLTKSGPGTLTLSANNSYTGVTTVSSNDTNGGIVNVSGDQSAANGGWIINGTSVVNFLSGSKIALAAGKNITLNNAAGAHSLNVSGTVTSAGSLAVRGRSTLNLESGADWTQNGSLTVQPLTSGYGATMNVKTGASFTYGGTSNITLAKSNSSANPGGASITISGGTFTTGKGFDNTVVTATTTGNTTLNFSNGGTLKLSADIPSLIIQGSTAFRVVTGTGNGVIDTNGFATGIPVVISGAGGLTKAGDGTLTLSAANTYAGDTTVTGGTLVLGAANTSNDASTVTISGSGVLQLTYTGTDTVDKLFIGTTQRAAGEYGKVGSASPVIGIPEIAGDGTLTVTSNPTGTPFQLFMAPYTDLTGNDALPEADPDGDGLSNVAEFIMGGTAPNSGGLANRPVHAEISGFLTISVLVPSGTTFTGSPSPATTVQGVEVAIGGSLDLATFARSVEKTTLNPGLPSAPSGYEWHTFRLVDPISSQSRGFLRASFNIP